MFDLEAQIKQWREQLVRTGIAREVVDELEAHLREHVDRLSAGGCTQQEAFQSAVRQLGDNRTIKEEFSKLKRSPWRIFRGHPLGIKVLAVWFVIMGLNSFACPLRQFAVNFFEEVRPVFPHHFGWNSFAMGGLSVLIGTGLLRRWRFCRSAALLCALSLISSRIYYFALAHAIPGAPIDPHPAGVNVHYEFFGMFVPHWFFLMQHYIGLPCLSWGVIALLQPPVEKLLRRMAAD